MIFLRCCRKITPSYLNPVTSFHIHVLINTSTPHHHLYHLYDHDDDHDHNGHHHDHHHSHCRDVLDNQLWARNASNGWCSNRSRFCSRTTGSIFSGSLKIIGMVGDQTVLFSLFRIFSFLSIFLVLRQRQPPNF